MNKIPYHTLQRANECSLAAVCFAKNLSYVEMSNKFVAKYGQRWDEATIDHKVAYEFLRELGVKGNWFNQSEPMRGIPDLRGRGVFTILIIRYNKKSRHAVAFRDGVIHDSGRLYPMPFDQWLRTYRRICIDGLERFE